VRENDWGTTESCGELKDSPDAYGKSTVAQTLAAALCTASPPLPGVGTRVCLTALGSPAAGESVPPSCWGRWADGPPAPAAWLVDGADEALDSNRHLLDSVAGAVEDAPDEYLRHLRLVVFSRPYAELGGFRDRLQRRYGPVTGRLELPRYWLARLDRSAAAALIGPDRFAAVEDLIRRNQLQSVAGYPVVLHFLKDVPPGKRVADRSGRTERGTEARPRTAGSRSPDRRALPRPTPRVIRWAHATGTHTRAARSIECAMR
jgi:hypothetical protein